MGKNSIKPSKEPQLREISFEGNMASTYEKNLKKRLARTAIANKRR